MNAVVSQQELVQATVGGQVPDIARSHVVATITEAVERNAAVVLLPFAPLRLLDTEVQGWTHMSPYYLLYADTAVQIRIDGPAIVWAEISNDPEWLGWEPIYRPITASCAWRAPDGHAFTRFRAQRQGPRRISPQERFRRGMQRYEPYAPESLVEPRVRIGAVCR